MKLRSTRSKERRRPPRHCVPSLRAVTPEWALGTRCWGPPCSTSRRHGPEGRERTTGNEAETSRRQTAEAASYPTPKGRQSANDASVDATGRPRRPRRREQGHTGHRCLRVGACASKPLSGGPAAEQPSSRRCSAGESVTSPGVAASGTSYPSMGFHSPLRGLLPPATRACRLDWEPKFPTHPTTGTRS